MSKAPTRNQLFEELIEARDEPCYNVKYEFKGERDFVIVFADSEEEAIERFDELSSRHSEVVAAHLIT